MSATLDARVDAPDEDDSPIDPPSLHHSVNHAVHHARARLAQAGTALTMARAFLDAARASAPFPKPTTPKASVRPPAIGATMGLKKSFAEPLRIVRDFTNGATVVLVVVDGEEGSGFNYTIGDHHSPAEVAQALRAVADDIERGPVIRPHRDSD